MIIVWIFKLSVLVHIVSDQWADFSRANASEGLTQEMISLLPLLGFAASVTVPLSSCVPLPFSQMIAEPKKVTSIFVQSLPSGRGRWTALTESPQTDYHIKILCSLSYHVQYRPSFLMNNSSLSTDSGILDPSILWCRRLQQVIWGLLQKQRVL